MRKPIFSDRLRFTGGDSCGAGASVLGLIRGPKDTHFSDQDAALLRLLLPHLQRGIGLNHRIARLETEKQAGTEALNRWRTGVILFDEAGHILLMNRAAEAILAQKGRYGIPMRPASCRHDRGYKRSQRPDPIKSKFAKQLRMQGIMNA